MAKEQKKDTKQGKKTVRKEQGIVLSKNSDKLVRYKIIKIQQNVVMYKKNKTDTANTSVQSQKKADEKPENLQKAANISSKSRRRSSSSASLSKPTTSENNSGDKYRDIAKITAARKMNEAQNGAVAQRATDTNYRVQNQAVVNAMSSSETDRHKAKAAEINEKLKADVTKARNNTAAVENDMKAFVINKAKETYKVRHLVKKGTVDSERFRNAVNNTIKKEIEQDANYNKYKGEAILHYKKMICYTNQEHQISKKLKKADNTASQNEKLLKTATTVVTLVKNPQRAVTNLAEDVIRKSKLGNASLTVAGDIRSFEDASKANSIGDGFSQAMTVLPEKYLKNAVKKTATDVITGRTKAEQLAKKEKKIERKYGHEAAKAHKAERNAKYAKESAMRKAKVQFYKEEKGLVKSASAMKNAKIAVKKAAEALGKVALEAGKKAIGTLIAALGPELLIILLIIMVIASLFTWLNPHEETFYNEVDNTWEPVMVESNEEILKGYIKHIQDYFDERQLDILEVVDFNYGGFIPDKYDYKDDYLWSLNEYGNKWIKLSDDCDFEHIIAMAAVKKWREIEDDGFDPTTYKFEITNDDLDYCLDNLFEFYYSYRIGACREGNCHKYTEWHGMVPVEKYCCNRIQTHPHLFGQVTNLELIGGYELVLNKILNIPVRLDFSTDIEYNDALRKFEADKEIYDIYVEFVTEQLGTSTKLPDYENDIEAQTRLQNMHFLRSGKKPGNAPRNVKVSSYVESTKSPELNLYENHYFLNISWDAPAPEEYAKDKFVEISGYRVFATDANGDTRLLTDITGTSINAIDYRKVKYVDEYERISIQIQAYNGNGYGPLSTETYVLLNYTG